MSFIWKIPYAVFIFFLSLKYQFVWGQNRISGGDIVEIEKVPYSLFLRIPLGPDTTTGCGAAIIGKEWGLTAAHCFRHENTKWDEVVVNAGRNDLLEPPQTYQIHRLTERHTPKIYKPDNETPVPGDIAVFKVSPPFNYTKSVQPVKLPENGHHYNTSWGTLAGWGAIYSTGFMVNRLHMIKLPRMNTKTCENKISTDLNTPFRLRFGEICYGSTKGKVAQNACRGDSGSSLVSSEGVVIGVVAWGIDCDKAGSPVIFTNTQVYRNWIKEKTGI